MKSVVVVLLIGCVPLIVNSAFAAEEVATIECSQVENARERLACFDAMYPRDPQRPIAAPKPRTFREGPAPVAPSAPIKSTKTREEVLDAPGAVEARTHAIDPAEDAPIRGQAKESKGGLFRNQPNIDFTSTIEAIKAEPQKKMVFRLANGQIWLQSTPRELPFSEGDVISVKSGKLGGFILRNEQGTSTRVTRIK